MRSDSYGVYYKSVRLRTVYALSEADARIAAKQLLKSVPPDLRLWEAGGCKVVKDS